MGKEGAGEDTTWFTGSSCSPEQLERQVQTQEGKGRETTRYFEGNFPYQQDMDLGSQVAIRQNSSVL